MVKDIKPLIFDQWVTKARTFLSYGSSRLYNTLIEKDKTFYSGGEWQQQQQPKRNLKGDREIKKESVRQFPYVAKSGSMVHEHGLTVDPPAEDNSWETVCGYPVEKDSFFPGSGSLLDCPPDVGDLVVVKCDLQFATTGASFPTIFVLPESLSDRFVAVDIYNPKIIKSAPGSHYFPILNLNVFFDIDGILDLTADDYVENMNDTKFWDRNEVGGFRQKDYIRKRDWIDQNYPDSLVKSSGKYSRDYVEFHTLAWRESDLITGIPGIVETRREKHWFLDNWNSNIYRSFRDLRGNNYVKFPLVGVVGTLLEKKVVTHSLTPGGDYIGGTDFQTTFYKILFRDRVPVWVEAPVWKCPDPLCLPIYLPIP